MQSQLSRIQELPPKEDNNNEEEEEECFILTKYNPDCKTTTRQEAQQIQSRLMQSTTGNNHL